MAERKIDSHLIKTSELKDWEKICHQSFDYVIVGSSFCCLAFVTRALENNPSAKILIIERGCDCLSDHCKNTTEKCPDETFPWSLSEETKQGKYFQKLHGTYPYFGGKSSLWSGWCPEPSEAEMEGWPKEIVQAVKENFSKAKKLLNIVPADEIFCCGVEEPQHPMFGNLQNFIQEKLAACKEIKGVKDVIPAPLAVKAKDKKYDHYLVYSVVEPLRQLLSQNNKNVQIITKCCVTEIKSDENGRAIKLETSRGDLELQNAKLILAMGILQSTTLILNSFPRQKNVGKRFSAHFVSSITARMPITSCSKHNPDPSQFAGAGAMYVSGEGSNGQQFHIQIKAASAKETIEMWMPNLPSVIKQQEPAKHIIIICDCIGELDFKNEDNKFSKLDNISDKTRNCQLHVVLNNTDNALWDAMDETAFRILDSITTTNEIEYWHKQKEQGSETNWDKNEGTWKKQRPHPNQQFRKQHLVHEASTMWIGYDTSDAPVGLDYCLRDTDNVYITGASLWPRGGSWNPVATVVSMAMDLADKICKPNSKL